MSTSIKVDGRVCLNVQYDILAIVHELLKEVVSYQNIVWGTECFLECLFIGFIYIHIVYIHICAHTFIYLMQVIGRF